MIQRLFSQAYFEALGQRQAEGISFEADELLVVRLTMRAKQQELIQEEKKRRQECDEAVRAYVDALAGSTARADGPPAAMPAPRSSLHAPRSR